MNPSDDGGEKIVRAWRDHSIDQRILPDGSVAVLHDLLFTTAILLSCTELGYGARFCFNDPKLAKQRFSELQSEDDQPKGCIASRQ